MFFYFLQGLALGLPAAAQPGPMQAYLLSQTIRQGWRRTLPAAFAPLISDGPVVILTLWIITQAPDSILQALRIIGGFFLLYLAWTAYQGMKTAVVAAPSSENPTQHGIFKAALLNALSPNPYIFWATIAGPIFLEGWRGSPLLGAAFAFGFYITLIGGFAAFVLFFSITGRLDPKINRALNGFAAVALALFGLRQLWIGGLKLL